MRIGMFFLISHILIKNLQKTLDFKKTIMYNICVVSIFGGIAQLARASGSYPGGH